METRDGRAGVQAQSLNRWNSSLLPDIDQGPAVPPIGPAHLHSTGASMSSSHDASPHYYHAGDLGRFPEIARGNDGLAEKFFAWYGAVFAEGALTAREKSLIALAVSHAVQCPYCIDAYSKDALEKGSNLDEMTEAVHVAAAIRGGASLVHGIQMLNRVDHLGM